MTADLIPDPEFSFAQGVEVLAAIFTVQGMSDQWADDVVMSDAGEKMQESLARHQIENPGTGEAYQEQLDLLKRIREEEHE